MLRFAVLTLGVAGDLLVLGIFKYAGFLAANINALFSTGFVVNILLPVGISFYTFTQIAFLVEPTGARSRATRCRIMRCSSPISRI